MKRGAAIRVMTCLALAVCAVACADDAVGVFRVGVASNGEVAVAMPFMPFGGDPGSFLSGPFAGDGWDGSDLLHHVSATSLATYVYSQDGWRQREGTSSVAIVQGDAMVFSPGGGGQPVDFLVYGKVPAVGSVSTTLTPGENILTHGYPSQPSGTNALPPELSTPMAWDGSPYTDGVVPWWEAFIVTNSSDSPVEWTRRRPYLPARLGYPRVAGMSVDGEGESAEMHVVTGGRKTDMLSLDSADGFADAAAWTHVGRESGAQPSFTWSDATLADIALSGAARFYMVSDAQRDADGDGVPDAVERYVYGTSHTLADTDGDGMDDGLELAWGTDPLVHDQPAPYSFIETFERPGVRPGGIGGQRGWMAANDRSAVVQGRVVHEGAGALELGGELDDMVTFDASHSVTCSADSIWIDFRLMTAAVPAFALQGDQLVSYAFDGEGHPVMSDGDAVRTNFLFSADRTSRWTRCTCMLDFRTRTWDFYVDGMIAGSGLALRGTAVAMREFGWSGSGFVDDMKVSTERPSGLSSDGDALPDEWEFRHFGTLERDGSGDADGDGISDLAEFRARTDPLSPDIDTDGDGRPDWWELANGLDPRSADGGTLPIFAESFERPEVSHGDIDGQNGWVVRRQGDAVVQGDMVHSGEGALRFSVPPMAEEDETVSISHAVESDSDMVWIDVRQFVSRGMSMRDVPDDAFVLYGFDADGHPVMADGDRIVTNRWCATVGQFEWARCTCRVDFGEQVWDLYVNGLIVGRGLALRGKNRTMHTVGCDGASGALDDLVVTKGRPSGLSSDGDAMPDEWELEHFGTLDRDGTGDADGDGMADLAEFRAGTDPSVPDTDGDGIPDGWEAANGLDPMDPSDAALDPDGDGVPNAEEYAFGGDPNLDEPDPRVRRPGLRCEFWRMYGKHATMPDFAALMPSALSVTPRIEHPEVPWLDDGTDPGNYFACRMEGFIRIPSAGRYTFHLTSNPGAVLSVDGETVLSDPVEHSSRERSVSLDLSVGYHPVRVDFYKNKGTEALVLEWSGDGLERSVIPDSAFCHIPEAGAAPHGYVRGLDVAYYAFPSALREMPDVEGMSPAATCVVGRVCQPRTADAWEGAPETLVDRFAAVYQGALLAPEPGRYTFALSSDDGARLWIDGEKVIDRSPAQGWATRQETVALAKGVHGLKVEYFENTGSAGVQLAWSKDGTQSETIPSRFFLRPSGEPVDGDGDGMPDWWELSHGLDPDDPADASPDPDGDGLANLDEFLAGTDPHSADTDGDGLPDAWEKLHGTCSFLPDALSDPDGDGLLSIEEFTHGTEPLNADTDGDGCLDGQEVHNVRGNPLVADIDWTAPFELGSVASGASAISSTGTWRIGTEGVIYASERSGSLSWALAVPEGGADALAVRVEQHEFYSKMSTFDLSLKIDGMFVSRQTVTAPHGSPSDAFFFLPEIPVGEHEFVLVWHNWEVNTFLAVHDLRFVKFGGPDLNANGIADWKDHRITSSTALDALPLESLVSPLCVEGKDLWRDVLEICVSYPETNACFAAVKTIGDGFYANIPLPESGCAVISLADRSLTNAFPVVWSEFDCSTGAYETNALVVRRGDSLRIAGFGHAECTVTVSRATSEGEWLCVSNWMQTASTPYMFGVHGLYLISVLADGFFGRQEAFALVDVMESRFPKRNQAVQMDMVQDLHCPDLSPRSLIEHDPGLSVEASVLESGGVRLSLLTHASYDLGLGVVSRIDEDGAILDAMQVTPVWFDNGTYYHVAQTYPDGSQLVEVSLLLGAMPEGMTVKLEIFVSGVTFEDGTRTKVLTSGDLDENGHCTIRFIRARGVTTSVCHRTYLYQDGELIYTNK